jgi:CheY-like chemotaxis protein
VECLTSLFQVDQMAVQMHLDEHIPLVHGDAQQWQQVLLLLLTNAHHALQAASEPRQLTVTTQYSPMPPQVTLTVTHSGPGGSRCTTTPLGGSMEQGLSWCRAMVESAGGSLRMTSTPGQDTSLQITLPVEAVPALPATLASAAEESVVRRLTILLVDDELSLARGLARLLERDGHTVDMVANGRLALARLDERAYDLILCDIRMPELDGPGLYQLLQRQHPHLCQQLIFLTGDTLEPTTGAFLEESGVPCLTKPFTLDETRRAIQRAVRPGRSATPAAHLLVKPTTVRG